MLEKRSIAAVIVVISLAVIIGIGLSTFKYAAGLSYMSNDPSACKNCHIMNDQYDSWIKGPHHAVATCNDCHVPHDFVLKYLAKAENGYHHSKGFTLQDFHEPVMIKEKNSKILQANCLSCHADFVHDVFIAGPAAANSKKDALQCVHCHRGVGHGAVR